MMRNQQEEVDIDKVIKRFQELYQRGEWEHTWGRDLLCFNPFESSKADTQANVSPLDELMASVMNSLKIGTPCVIVSLGQSGAGKTTTIKRILGYIKDSSTAQIDVSLINRMERILELLGHARTPANPNSSRFVKTVEIYFDTDQQVIGIQYKASLLQSSRTCKRGPNDGNFTLFEHFDDHILELSQLLTELGINGGELEDITNMLRLSKTIQETQLDESGSVDETDLEMWAGELGISIDDLSDWIMRFEGRKIVENVREKRASLCAAIFEVAFDHTIALANCILRGSQSQPHAKVSLELVDLFGFESAATNGMSTFVINCVNDMMHELWSKVSMEDVLATYEAEGIDASKFSTKNSSVESKANALAILKKAINQATSDSLTDLSFLNTLDDGYWLKKYHIDRWDKFCAPHYGSRVEYALAGFLDDNKRLSLDILAQSAIPWIAGLTTEDSPSELVTTESKWNTLALSMQDKKIHFIHHIIPNLSAKPRIWDSELVTSQFQAARLMDAIRIQLTYHEYSMTKVEMVKSLQENHSDAIVDEDQALLTITAAFNADWYTLGRTRVFYGSEVKAILDARGSDKLLTATSDMRQPPTTEDIDDRSNVDGMGSSKNTAKSRFRDRLKRIESRKSESYIITPIGEAYQTEHGNRGERKTILAEGVKEEAKSSHPDNALSNERLVGEPDSDQLVSEEDQRLMETNDSAKADKEGDHIDTTQSRMVVARNNMLKAVGDLAEPMENLLAKQGQRNKSHDVLIEQVTVFFDDFSRAMLSFGALTQTLAGHEGEEQEAHIV